MTDKDEVLSVRRQCHLLSLHRSTAYYELAPPSVEDHFYILLFFPQ